jgi:hypothetical protein
MIKIGEAKLFTRILCFSNKVHINLTTVTHQALMLTTVLGGRNEEEF